MESLWHFRYVLNDFSLFNVLFSSITGLIKKSIENFFFFDLDGNFIFFCEDANFLYRRFLKTTSHFAQNLFWKIIQKYSLKNRFKIFCNNKFEIWKKYHKKWNQKLLKISSKKSFKILCNKRIENWSTLLLKICSKSSFKKILLKKQKVAQNLF